MYRGAADLLYFCTILHFRYININIYTINFVHWFVLVVYWNEEKNDGRHSVSFSVWFLDLWLFSRPVFVSLLLFFKCFVSDWSCSLSHSVSDSPAASSGFVSFTSCSASQCQSSSVYIHQTRLDSVVFGTCTEIKTCTEQIKHLTECSQQSLVFLMSLCPSLVMIMMLNLML